jgi:hypothetical protein
MYDRSIIAVLETAIDRYPYCAVCGAQNDIRADDAGFILECGSAQDDRGLVSRVLFALLPHDRRRVLP